MAAASVFAFVMALATIRVLWSGRFAKLILDHPNDRTLHERPTARTGGIGIIGAAGLAWMLFSSGALLPVVALTAALSILFLLEDALGLPLIVRLAAQISAAALFLMLTGPYPPLLILPLVLGMTWSANLYNFMDGSHGLAGGMAIVGFGTYALGAGMAGHADIVFVAAIVAAAAVGFLVWNFEPSRIFMGDAGSIPLGFLAAAIGIVGWNRGAWPFWFPVLVFLPFVFDATWTLLSRALAGHKIWRPHREHTYQRVIQMGWSHTRVALLAYAIMLCCAAAALSLREARLAIALPAVAVLALLHAAAAIAVGRRWQRFTAGR